MMLAMQQILVPLLAFLAVTFIGAAIITGIAARKRRIQARLQAEPYDLEQQEAGVSGRLVGSLQRLGTSVSSGRQSANLRSNLVRAGYHSGNAAAVYLGAKMVLLVLGILLSLAVFVPAPLPFSAKSVLILLSVAMVFFIPNMVVYVRRRKRRREIRHHLPDAIDLMEICVSAGMGMDMAWNMVSDEMRNVCPDLADEMALTNLEIHLGASRVVAMRHMADRTGADELGSLVAVLVQSERFGTSISDALRTFAGSLREGRSAHAEEAAEKTAVKLLFPMVLLIFPAMLIVIVGPAGIKFVELLL